jgi:hypothetical protein
MYWALKFIKYVKTFIQVWISSRSMIPILQTQQKCKKNILFPIDLMLTNYMCETSN